MRNKIIVFIAVYMVIVPGILLTFTALKEGDTLGSMIIFLSGGIITGVAVLIAKILKKIIRRRRISQKEEYFTPLDKFAFPSGHATGLFAVTVFIFEKNVELGMVSLFFSLLIVMARIMSNVHDYVDTLGGIILGASIAYYLTPIVEPLVSTLLVTHRFL